MKVMFACVVLAAGLATSPLAAQAIHNAATPKPSIMSRLKAATQTHAAPAARSDQPTKSTAQAPRTAKSLACSAQADKQNIHGKARKSFMSRCKKA